MPTATPFTALGRGNGFPFCITEIDISTFPSNYKWTTLSGVNTDNYTTFSGSSLLEKVNSSQVMAMSIYWNKFKSNGLSASSSGYSKYRNSRFQPTSGLSVTWNTSLSGMTDSDAISVEDPVDRLCTPHYKDITKSENIEGTDQDGGTDNVGSLSIKDSLSSILALYDEDTLLGYATLPSTYPFNNSSSSVDADGFTEANCYITVNSVVDAQPDINEDFEKKTTDYEIVNGMHFVVIKYGKIYELTSPESGDGYSGIVNTPAITFNANSVEVSYLYQWDYDPDDDPACPLGRFCFPQFQDRNFTCSVSGPASVTYYTY